MFKKGVVLILCIISSAVNAGVISVGMTTAAVPVAETGTAWGGGATFLAGTEAVNANGNLYGDQQATYLQFDLSSIAESITAETEASNWTITSITLSLPETWYPHNTSFYLGAGMFDISMVSGTTWNALTFDPTTNVGITSESVGEFYHEWENTDIAWHTQLDTISYYELTLTGSLLSTLIDGQLLNLYMSPIDSTVGLAFFNQNWGGEPLLEIEYSSVPEPTTIMCLLSGLLIQVIRKRHESIR